MEPRSYTMPILQPIALNNSTIQKIVDCKAIADRCLNWAANFSADAGNPPQLTRESLGFEFYLEHLQMHFYLPSLGNSTPAPDIKPNASVADRLAKMQNLASAFPKCQWLLHQRANASASWIWIYSSTCQNFGDRVNSENLKAYLTAGEVDLFDGSTELGLQFIADPNFKVQLPSGSDRITVRGGCRAIVSL